MQPPKEDIERAIDENLTASVQGRSDNNQNSLMAAGFFPGVPDTGVLFQLGVIADEIPRWSIYPGARDYRLRQFYKMEPIMAGAVYSLEARMKSMDWQLNSEDERGVTAAELMLESADLGGGLRSLLGKTVIDLCTQDNGAFWEIVGRGNPDSALIGAPTGVNYLDPARCYRTYDPEYPVLYIDPVDGSNHRLHRTRVVMMSSMTQPDELGRGVGFCPLSRALRQVQLAKSMLDYRYEKTSGSFERAIGYGSGVSKKTLETVMRGVENQDVNEGFTRIGRIPFVVSTQGVDLDVLDLASIPENFDLRDEIEVYVYIVSLAFGVDAREFWPATVSGATKADASIQNMKARGKGLADLLTILESGLNRIMPPGVEFKFDFVDSEQDKETAQTNQTVTQTLTTIRQNGGLTPAQYQAALIRAGVLDETQLQSASDVSDLSDDPDGGDTADTDGENRTESGADAVEQRTKGSYRRRLREAVRGLYRGDLTLTQFVDSMDRSIQRGFRQAWRDGAAQEGIEMSELNDDERRTLRTLRNREFRYVLNFGQDILQGRRDEKPLSTYIDRVDGWVSRYDRVKAKASLMAARDKKKEWSFDPSKENCTDCARLNGRVHRASIWDKYGIEPQSPLLECFGIHCGCELKDTDKAGTPGRPPRIFGQKLLRDMRDRGLKRLHDAGRYEDYVAWKR